MLEQEDVDRIRDRRSFDDELMSKSLHCDDQDSDNCQRCLLSSLSSRTLSTLDDNRENGRFISQREYKRKISRRSVDDVVPSYATLGRTVRKRSLEDDENGLGLGILRMVSKTTFQWDDIDMIEVPTSPTNYSQPPTPEGVEPPSAFEAERQIGLVIDRLRSEAKRSKRSRAVETEKWMLLAPGVLEWPIYEGPTSEAATSPSATTLPRGI